MPNLIPPSECDRARESVSCRLDGELSQIETASLDDHLRDCGACSAYARELYAVADRLRAAPLEQPDILVFVPARRRPHLRLQTAAAAAALVAVATGSSFAVGRLVGVHGASGSRTLTAAVEADFLGLQADSNQQHILAMLRSAPSDSLRAGREIAV